MNDKDRIRLAEAMGIPDITQEAVDIDSRTICTWNERDNFNPFTDANDDYAVLSWLRATPEHHSDAMMLLGLPMRRYRIGDYARAALKVLDDDG